MNTKTLILTVGTFVLVVVAIFVIAKTASSGGATQSNVADFAKSIDDTKGNTPSVPPERLALGRTGAGRRGR